ncbi:hypothetical protein HZS_85 [Henneguya salminicola]|nr:hypothetical protein HZS_85 [Henneguya salminicola]
MGIKIWTLVIYKEGMKKVFFDLPNIRYGCIPLLCFLSNKFLRNFAITISFNLHYWSNISAIYETGGNDYYNHSGIMRNR